MQSVDSVEVVVSTTIGSTSSEEQRCLMNRFATCVGARGWPRNRSHRPVLRAHLISVLAWSQKPHVTAGPKMGSVHKKWCCNALSALSVRNCWSKNGFRCLGAQRSRRPAQLVTFLVYAVVNCLTFGGESCGQLRCLEVGLNSLLKASLKATSHLPRSETTALANIGSQPCGESKPQPGCHEEFLKLRWFDM